MKNHLPKNKKALEPMTLKYFLVLIILGLAVIFSIRTAKSTVTVIDTPTPVVTPTEIYVFIGADSMTPVPLRNFHEVQAEYFEKLAADMARIIAENQTLKASIKAQGLPGDWDTRCDAVIKDAERLKAEYENLAKWSRQQAALSKFQQP